MIDKIKELVSIFRKTYEKVNEEKIRGKEYLDKIEGLKNTKIDIYHKIVDLQVSIEGVKEFIPEQVWNHFFSPILNFLKFGYSKIKRINGTSFVDYPKNIGYIEDLEVLNEDIDVEYQKAKKLFEEGKYEEIETIYKGVINIIIKKLGYYK